MKLRDVSIRGKLLVLAAATSAVALLLSGVVLLASSYVLLRSSSVRELEAQASIVADNTTAAIRFVDAEAANETLHALRALPGVDVACVFDVDPKPLLGTYVAPGSPLSCPPVPPGDRSDVSLTGLVVVRPIMFKDERVGTVYLHGNLHEVWARLRSESWTILAAFAIGSIGALLIAARLRQIISRPIVALSTTAATISQQGDYSLRAHKEGQDEIGVLVDTFNNMVSQVERREQDLRAANKLKDEFLATLSHELRTPLNAIVGWLQVLRLAPHDTSTTERALTSLERNAKIQVRLIEDLLDVSSIASGKLRLSFAPVDLVDVTNAALEVVRPTAEVKGVSISGLLSSGPRLVAGDAGRLEQVIWNLLSNAIKFTAPGGHVLVSVSLSGDEYVVRVEDDGQGITPEFLPHVFDRFRQADGSMTRRHGGLGVGLAIARELTERHGGRIVAESGGTGLGARFSLFLPQSQPSTAAGKPTVEPPDSRRHRPLELAGLRILVIDDEADARQIASQALVSGGARVETASDGTTALTMLAARAFDAIVCDIAMPAMDGYELLRRIRSQTDGAAARTPAIAATAYADDESRVRATQAGFQGFVVKPFAFETLAIAVKSAVAK